jgi:hypothetical protein
MRMQAETDCARQAADRDRAQRTYMLHMVGLGAGFLLSAGMLVGAVIVGMHHESWLACLLAGPSMLSLAGLFVIRRTDVAAKTPAEQLALPAPQPPRLPDAVPADGSAA